MATNHGYIYRGLDFLACVCRVGSERYRHINGLFNPRALVNFHFYDSTTDEVEEPTRKARRNEKKKKRREGKEKESKKKESKEKGCKEKERIKVKGNNYLSPSSHAGGVVSPIS